MSRLQTSDPLEHGAGGKAPREGEDLIKAGQINFPHYGRMLQQPLDLGSEEEQPVGLGIKERRDTDMIPRQQ